MLILKWSRGCENNFENGFENILQNFGPPTYSKTPEYGYERPLVYQTTGSLDSKTLETWEFSRTQTYLVRIYDIVSKTYMLCLIGPLAHLFQLLDHPGTYNDIFISLDLIQGIYIRFDWKIFEQIHTCIILNMSNVNHKQNI